MIDRDIKEELEVQEGGNYVFVIDRSGSMYSAITIAKEALVLFLQSLPPKSKFNIVSFGSDFVWYSSKLMENSKDKIKQAAEHITSTFEADLGGTEIYKPLKSIYGKISENSQVFLLTDGGVGNTQQVVDLIK